MFKNMKIGTKIASLAGILILLTLIVGGFSYTGFNKVTDRTVKADDTNRLVKDVLKMRLHQTYFMADGDRRSLEKANAQAEKITAQALDTQSRFRNPAHKKMMDEVIAATKEYHGNSARYAAIRQETDAIEKKWRKAGEEFVSGMGSVKSMIAGKEGDGASEAASVFQDRVWQQLMLMRISGVYFVKDKTAGSWKAFQKEFNALTQGLKAWSIIVKPIDAGLADAAEDMQRLANAYGRYGNAYWERILRQKETIAPMVAAATKAQAICEEARADQKAKMLARIGKTENTLMLIAGFALVFGSIMTFFLIRMITRPVTRTIDALNAGAMQVAAASNQVSQSSQGLAEGASEQAAAIEETSSALEEISSGTRQNADRAETANQLMLETRALVDRVNASIESLIGAMAEIEQGSKETSTIIKSIDEIAFQTNLLSLNAAVEAARAGEAGAGFAVVADEVRNLAHRAADEAGSTSELIGTILARVEKGVHLVKETGRAFSEVSQKAQKTEELVSEITIASGEQHRGIEQVNTAVVEMDKVTQQNAANAEESASASEELNAQAEEMKSAVENLSLLVSGNGAVVENSAGQAPKAVDRAHCSGRIEQREIRPERILPLDEAEEFSDF